MATTTMSIRLPEELAQELDILAKANKRSKSFYAVEAIKRYVEKESWQTKAVEAGIEDADNGQLMDHEKVKNWVESWDTKNETGPPK